MAGILDTLGVGLDRLIAIIAPIRAQKRMIARSRMDILRQYAAAKSNRLTGPWSPANQNVNQLIASSSGAVRARVRQLVRDFPYFARAVSVLVDHTTGSGFHFQAKIRGSDGKLNRSMNQQLEDAWSRWCEEADIAGKLHFHDICRLTKRQDVESGEYFVVINELKPNGSRFLPFALQVFESDWLSSQYDTYPSSGPVEIYQGIEYEKASGRILAYHFTDPDAYRKALRVPASRVIHGFETFRPNQLRGISPFTPAVLVAHDLGEFMDAELDAAKLAAKWLAFVETGDLAGYQSLRAETDPNTGHRVEQIENAIIEYLRPGEKISLSSYNRPGDSFEPFTKLILRMVAVTVGVSYELLSGDYQDLNYSVLRGIRNDLLQAFRPIQARHIRQLCVPVHRRFMDALAVSNRIPTDYFSNPIPYLRCQWLAPGTPPVDPLKEGRAEANAISNLLKSPQEVAAARGRDYEEVLDEIQAARQMQQERELEVIGTSKSAKTNPASLTDQGVSP